MNRKDVRKIYKSGKGSYILTLPKEWITENGLKEGDVLHLDIQKDAILVSLRGKTAKEKVAEINAENKTFNELVRIIISHYLAVYDLMNVKVHSDEQRRAVAFAVDMLVGAEIMEDTGNELSVEVFLDLKRFNVIDVTEKIFRICDSMLSDFQSIVENFNRAVCSSIMVRENEIDKIHFLALRLLNAAMDGEDVGLSIWEIVNYRSVIRTLERIADHISSMSEALVNLNSDFPEVSELTKDVRRIFRESMVAFFKRDSEIAEEVLEKYEVFENEIQRYYENILNLDAVRVMNAKTILDGLLRVAAYSADISEVVLNMAVWKR